jgi:hypothetical protein
MATITEIPTMNGRPFSEIISWNGVDYLLVFKWNIPTQCWMLDILDSVSNTPILMGLALVTGCDILEQFGYLEVAAQAAMTIMVQGPFVSPDTIPNFTNLGVDGHLYLLTP